MKPIQPICRWPLRSLALTFATASAWAAAAHVAPTTTPDLVLSEDDAYVIDLKTKLAWPRCVEGMAWNGKTCTGEPHLMTHAEAVAWVASRKKTDGVPWRLPRVPELQHLVSKKGALPGLDPQLFPRAPRDWHWTITSNVHGNTAPVNQYNYGNIAQGQTSGNANHMAFLHGWAVDLTTGEARGDLLKRTPFAVRLVRPID